MNIFARTLIAVALMAGSVTSFAQIRTEVPQRPAGQTDMVNFAAEPIKNVRVGFIGLGMRGPDAVKRFTSLVRHRAGPRDKDAEISRGRQYAQGCGILRVGGCMEAAVRP